ncbi:GTP pyrophosphokinase [Bacteroidales bacterium Barb6]|nr:GTP pyrophosphokinase [Bacteroidales bacterium Barb6]
MPPYFNKRLMDTVSFFTPEEKTAFFAKYRELLGNLHSFLEKEDIGKMKRLMRQVISLDCYGRDKNGINGLLRNVDTALIATKEIGLKRTPVIALLLYRPVLKHLLTVEEIEQLFDADTAHILRLLLKTSDLYAKNTAVNTENFRHLLFSFAEDVRVILLMIADRLCMMRLGKQMVDEGERLRLSAEAGSLYAPLAHRLGLYAIKSELEDLVLKYTEPQQFDFIRHKLNETKRSRDAYIKEFITPVKEKLEKAGLRFDIKGRTKSIHSINNKLKKQKVEFEDIYDLFAIRIILDTPAEKERAECWYAYSILTDMYQPNPNRMRDWLSIPKSNGYESLHITVMGPQKKWVEVQIRTERMDEIAELGLAAHWKYKGVKSDGGGVDDFLSNVRAALELSKEGSQTDLIQDFNMNLYKDEIYVFTPKGELIKLPQGATVLDFAFSIHTGLGSRCASALVNGRNVPIKHELHSGDTVSILTAASQSPKQDWLNMVITSKARIKIKQALREEESKNVEFAKETLQRRFKNRRIELDESVFMRYIKKRGFKTITDFYTEIAENRLDPNDVIDEYLELLRKENETPDYTEPRSAEGFVVSPPVADEKASDENILFVGKNLKGLDYKLAKCCNPIWGDDIFGFVSTQGIRVHRRDCPNSGEMTRRFAHRIIEASWRKTGGEGYIVMLRVIGRDDIAIVTNITSVIGKESDVTLRSLDIDSAVGIFQGNFSVMVNNIATLNRLLRKIKDVKGVKSVDRLNTKKIE